MVNNNVISFVSRNFNETNIPEGITIICRDFKFSNKLIFPIKPARALDGTLIIGSEYYYVPEAEFFIGAMSRDLYGKLVQIVNAPSFQVTCYDYELGKVVNREMMLSDLSRERLLGSGGNIEQLLNVKLSMSSVRAYKNYTELKNDNSFSAVN